MRLIPLTQGKFAKVDDDIFQEVSQYKWHAALDGDIWYAVGWVKVRRVAMHRFILKLQVRDGKIVDHKDRDGLNNQRENLRIVTHSQNRINSKINSNNKAGLRGLRWAGKKWIARIEIHKEQIHIGRFETKEEAYKAYCEAAKKYHGEFARI